MMPWLEWLNALLRWIHVIAGIMWIGDSLLFMWIDSHLHPDPQSRQDVAGVTWLIHGGGYYQLEKRWLAPGRLPPRLRWFWLEATTTWLSGILLLIIVYYMSAEAFMLDPGVSRLTPAQAITIGLGILLAGWLVYDGLWRALRHYAGVAVPLSVALLVVTAYAVTQVFSGRAAFLHIGALLGTIMSANVWVHIIPPQLKMVEAARQGRPIDFSLGDHAKTRSTHNTYLTFPVIFLMISHHFPGIYSGDFNWVTLLLLVTVGAGVRHLMLVGFTRRTTAVTVAVAIFLIVDLLPRALLEPHVVPSGRPVAAPSFTDVRTIIVQRCAACHSETPTEPGMTSTAGGVPLDTPQQIRVRAARIKVRAVEQRTMPLGNTTGITDEERAILGRWVDAGAPLR
jgi:uncharacterized membrane protein